MQGVKDAFELTVGDSIRCDELELVLKNCGVDDASAQYLLRTAQTHAVGEVLPLKSFFESISPSPPRKLSHAHGVAEAGGIDKWNQSHNDVQQLSQLLSSMCRATTVPEALAEAPGDATGDMLSAGWILGKLFDRSPDLYYATISAKPSMLLPAVYTPTVGEACQKFGKMPLHSGGKEYQTCSIGCFDSSVREGELSIHTWYLQANKLENAMTPVYLRYSRGCYLRISDKGNFKEVLREYAEAELEKDAAGPLVALVRRWALTFEAPC
eukprot:Skav213956  [mRNA]  locus=scaffold1979:230016:233600:- [translate_table: standard]